MEDEEIIDFDEIEFHGAIRSQVVCLLLFILLYAISFWVIQLFKSQTDSDELYAGDEDFFVYRISVWMCTCSLAVSIGAVTLLPFSVLGSEVLHSYPENFYLKWLNWSLINSLWNYVFLLSNISLFFLLPFAYFFIESQGFSFHQRPRPFFARVYETACVCALMIVILISLAHVFYSLCLSEKLSVNFSIFNFSALSIPLVYSFVSLIGVVLLLISTPLGFAKLFDVSSEFLFNKDAKPIIDPSIDARKEEHRPFRLCPDSPLTRPRTRPSNGPYGDFLQNSNKITTAQSVKSQSMAHVSYIKRAIKSSTYPLIILMLLFMTGISVFLVLINTIQLLFGFRVLPGYVQNLEVHSRHIFGVGGAVIENVIIMYIVLSAVIGVYSLPFLRRMRPVRGATSMTCVIANCSTILLLSSALPVLARTLGITSFDLLGSYGRLNWISNNFIVYSCNIAFAGLSTLCLLNKFTEPVRRELTKRIYSLYKKDDSSIDKKTN